MAKYYVLLTDEELDSILDFESDDASVEALEDFIENVQVILEEAPVLPEDEL